MSRIGDWIQTSQGRQFWPLDPRPEEIFLIDIANSLSKLCRYGGHCKKFYSVAEHSWLLSHAVSPEHALVALMHDASEAYLCDIPRPIKKLIPSYAEAEDRVFEAIAQRFGFDPEIPSEVIEADRRILMDERKQNMLPEPATWSTDSEPLGIELRLWNPTVACSKFIHRFGELTDGSHP